jgi:hypothetical protein
LVEYTSNIISKELHVVNEKESNELLNFVQEFYYILKIGKDGNPTKINPNIKDYLERKKNFIKCFLKFGTMF